MIVCHCVNSIAKNLPDTYSRRDNFSISNFTRVKKKQNAKNGKLINENCIEYRLSRDHRRYYYHELSKADSSRDKTIDQRNQSSKKARGEKLIWICTIILILSTPCSFPSKG